MTITLALLIGVGVLACVLVGLMLVPPEEPPTPKHAAWGETTRLTPPPGLPSARAGVLPPSGVFLVPEPGEDEWRFPPWPGDR